jgi:hypothetical protein
MTTQNLADKILKLKQEINVLGDSYPLKYIQIEFIEKMELEQEDGNHIFSSYLKELNKLTDKCLLKYEDYQAFMSVKNIYSEALVYSILKSVLKVEKIPESPKSSPDFEVNFKNENIYIEMKSLNMSDGTLKHKTIMENAFEGHIRIEEEIVKKRNNSKKEENIVVSDVRIDKPYERSSKAYNDSSPKLVIETLIGKMGSQNVHEDQFSYGDTVLLVDFSDQLLLLESPLESLQQEYIGEYRDNSDFFEHMVSGNLSHKDQMNCMNSIESMQKQKIYFFKGPGCLWHVAFGDIGSTLIKPEDSEDGKGEVLEKQGILKDKEFDFVKGIIFRINGKFYACMKGVEPNTIFEFFSYLASINFIENKSFSYLI